MIIMGLNNKLIKKIGALALGIVLAVSQAGLCVLAEPSETYNEVENEVSLENESEVTEETIENDTEDKDEIESDENSKKDDVDENSEDENDKDENPENENSEEESEVDKKTEEQNSGTEKDAQSDEEQAAFDMTKSCGDVSVLLSAPEGVFPKGAYFEVREVSNSEEKNIDEAISEIRDDSEQVAASYTYDITVYDKDGNEIEPITEYGQVSVTFSMDEATDSNLEAKVYHIETSEDAFLAEELETSVSGDEVTALTDGFSYYTVEFTYGDKLCYVLNGDEKTELLTILEACGIDADGEISEVVSSNTDLFKGVCENGVWFIYALKPFHTEETLKVTVNGKVYTIKVTDAEYMYWDPNTMMEVRCLEEYDKKIYEGESSLNERTYYFVEGNKEVNESITVNGSEDNSQSTYLILCNGATLTAEKGIYVGQGKGLYIYAQSPDSSSAMGTLEAVGETNNAGIGGNGDIDDGACGTIAIYGGNITVQGGDNAAGIGGGNGGSGTSISINGGIVTAQGGKNAAGIGGGNNGGGGSITINGGTVTANRGSNAAGIGGGLFGSAGDITINGGTVISEPPQGIGTAGAGIGSGRSGNGGSITINSGTVTATGSGSSAGIGGGKADAGVNITISGGTVNATGGNFAAGIGGGEEEEADNEAGWITICSGTIIATGGEYGGAGIGGGKNGNAGNISIIGGNVTAKGLGPQGGAGIGSGYLGGTSGSITIDNATVDATGGPNAAGIGAGMNAVNCKIIINGGNVTASGANGGAGIGSGYRDNAAHTTDDDTPGAIEINNGTVVSNGDTYGAGIGGGYNNKVGNITINGGRITATGGRTGGAGIGSGYTGKTDNCQVNILNGEITAIGGTDADGIGKGRNSGELDPHIDENNFKYIYKVNGKVILSKDAKVKPVDQPGEYAKSSNVTIEEVDNDTALLVSSEPLLKSFGGKGMGGLCTFEKQGPLCVAVFKFATPVGFNEAFTFNFNLDATGKTKPNYGKKTGKFVLNIPEKYQKKGRTFAIIGIDKSGKVKIFYDVDTDDKTFTTNLDIEGYAFSLVYTDLAIKNVKNTTLN